MKKIKLIPKLSASNSPLPLYVVECTEKTIKCFEMGDRYQYFSIETGIGLKGSKIVLSEVSLRKLHKFLENAGKQTWRSNLPRRFNSRGEVINNSIPSSRSYNSKEAYFSYLGFAILDLTS